MKFRKNLSIKYNIKYKRNVDILEIKISSHFKSFFLLFIPQYFLQLHNCVSSITCDKYLQMALFSMHISTLFIISQAFDLISNFYEICSSTGWVFVLVRRNSTIRCNNISHSIFQITRRIASS